MNKIENLNLRKANLIDEVRSLTNKEDITAEERTKADKMMEDLRNIETDIAREKELLKIDMESKRKDPEKEKAEWRSLGEFVTTVYTNPSDKRLKDRFIEVEGRQQQMAVGADGGFLVPDQFSNDLLTVQPDEAIVRPRANVFPAGGDADFHIPALQYSGNNMYAGAQVQWIDEGQLKPETEIEFKRITLHPFEVAAHVRVTDKLMRNASAIEQIVRTQLRGALINAEEAAFLTGNGVGQPTGLIGHASNVVVARNVPGNVVYQDLADMYARFRGRTGTWIVSRTVMPQLMALADPNGNFVWQPNARDGSPGTIFGMPVVFSENSPALGVQGDVVLADLSNYLIKDGVGVSIAASPHMLFTSNMTVIKAFKTVDGIPWLTGPLPTNPVTSPFVCLDA